MRVADRTEENSTFRGRKYHELAETEKGKDGELDKLKPQTELEWYGSFFSKSHFGKREKNPNVFRHFNSNFYSLGRLQASLIGPTRGAYQRFIF